MRRNRRILLLSLVAVALAMVVLNGCAAMPDEWNEYPTKQPLPAVVVRLPASEVTRICGKGTMGCAERDYVHGVCIVRMDIRPLPETFSHEALHCAGYDHD